MKCERCRQECDKLYGKVCASCGDDLYDDYLGYQLASQHDGVEILTADEPFYPNEHGGPSD